MQRLLRGGHGLFAALAIVLPAGLAGVVGLAGCVVEAGVAASAGVGGGPGIAVAGPPPEPMAEPRPPQPPGETVWIAGYWHWTGMRYTWIPGHWERAPAGAAWHAPRY